MPPPEPHKLYFQASNSTHNASQNNLKTGVISFDATYRSNKYSMVFVPFTGIDNHHCNVIFGAALLASETADTYIWLLRVFLKAVVLNQKLLSLTKIQE
ncbi:putative MULE transposase domain, FHY3/FAR1 family [Helianthus annuus]|uniref:MULE transposase domain, FHY3/FAR1 family n=1 Tax=Helianthus annuus TaxID=4232 RepID=A0A251SFB8_HELAN|nr:putative MULE transposase domain, FHY3/FAR1 family [Helianthus annuus]KAJ0839638.1 putative MULE transposase domain, FHY3/FAR1 family [Helianthus annuus]